MWKKKTLKNNTDDSTTTTTTTTTGVATSHASHASPSSLQTFLNIGVNEAFRRPWHRLERGLRLNRLNLFAQEEKERVNLTDIEAKNLYELLIKSLDKKVLNSKSTVTYDPEKERILEVKGLVSHRNAEGQTLYQIVERKSQSITFRKPRVAANPQQQQQQQQSQPNQQQTTT